VSDVPKGSRAEHHMANILASADAARDLIAKSPEATRCAMAILSVVLHYERLLVTRGRAPALMEPFLAAMQSSGIFSESVIEQCRASVAAHVPKQRLSAVAGGSQSHS